MRLPQFINILVLIFLKLKHYIAAEYGVCKGTACLSIQWVEDTLTKNGAFAPPGKKVLKRKSASITYVEVDVTESPINRPEKDQKAYYSGKNGMR
jgi:hypothetical protein